MSLLEKNIKFIVHFVINHFCFFKTTIKTDEHFRQNMKKFYILFSQYININETINDCKTRKYVIE